MRLGLRSLMLDRYIPTGTVGRLWLGASYEIMKKHSRTDTVLRVQGEPTGKGCSMAVDLLLGPHMASKCAFLEMHYIPIAT